MCRLAIAFILCFLCLYSKGQGNLVNNPSFELNCGIAYPPYWSGVDSANCTAYILASECSLDYPVPFNGIAFQFPKTGRSFVFGSLMILDSLGSNQVYFRNRLKGPLRDGETYCVRYYLNVLNNSTHSFDGLDVFVGNILDTFTKFPCLNALTSFSPQIANPANNFITDTLNWTPMQGTFTATGGEKFLTFGNFRGPSNTNSLVLIPNSPFGIFEDVCLDDFSLVPVNLPADAGPDKVCMLGDSVYIGRPLDVGTDYACTWYQLPNMNIPYVGVSGLWVKPNATYTYVVKQQLWCSGIRWDTVVVYAGQVGIKDLDVYLDNVKLFPNPANNKLSIQFTQALIGSSIKHFDVYNHLGQVIDASHTTMAEAQLQVDCADLSAGLYYIRFEVESGGSFVKKFVVER